MTGLTPVDFEELWLHPTPKGWKLSKQGQEEVAPIHLRVVIDAVSRDEWHISEIYAVNTQIVSQTKEGCRTKEYINALEGSCFDDARDFLCEVDEHYSRLEDRVFYEINEVA